MCLLVQQSLVWEEAVENYIKMICMEPIIGRHKPGSARAIAGSGKDELMVGRSSSCAPPVLIDSFDQVVFGPLLGKGAYASVYNVQVQAYALLSVSNS